VTAQTYERARAMYGSDEQMARDLYELLVIARIDLELQQALRRRAEDRLRTCQANIKMRNDGGLDK
jgi:hypothetical protein